MQPILPPERDGRFGWVFFHLVLGGLFGGFFFTLGMAATCVCI